MQIENTNRIEVLMGRESDIIMTTTEIAYVI